MRHTMQTKLSLLSISVMAAITLSGCGGGGSDTSAPVTPTPPPAATGGLDLTVTGLPLGIDGDISITGPNGYSANVTNSTALTGLDTGTYTVSIDPVLSGNLSFDVLPATFQLTVNANQVVSQSLTYMTSITSVGPISNFGSVYVNGVRFNSDDADVSVDDNDGTEDDLDKGMKVKIKGRITADGSVAIADSIDYDVDIKGPIDEISLTEGYLVVLGQTIFVDDFTQYEDAVFSQLLVGDVVEVSMIERDDTSFTATRVEKESADDDFEMRGRVQDLNSNNLTFTLNNRTVDYSTALQLDSFAEGDLVEIEFREVSPQGVIFADKVEREDDAFDSDDQGYITFKGDIVEISATEIVLSGGERIAIDGDTELENGAMSDLAVGLRVVIKAEREGNALVADDIWIIAGDMVVVRSQITDINVSDMEIEVLGRDFEITSHTVFVDKSQADVRRMTINDLAIGDEVEVVSIPRQANNDDDSLASKITRFDLSMGQSPITRLKGHLQAIDGQASTFSLRGLDISINASTEIYFDEQDRYITDEEFFQVAMVGYEVKAFVVTLEDGSLLALSIELDDMDSSDDDDDRKGSAKIEGIITQSLMDNQFALDGRVITINQNTDFEDGGISDLSEGMYVEVRIRETADGLVALEIEFDDRDDDDSNDDSNDDYEVEVKGPVANLTDDSFMVRGMMVLLTSDTRFDDGDINDLVNGVQVEVEGYLNAQGELVAKYIDFEREDDDDHEIAGLITEIVNDNEFYIGDLLVRLAPNVEFDEGNALKLAVDVFVKVEGEFDQEGVFIAREVEFKDDDGDDD